MRLAHIILISGMSNPNNKKPHHLYRVDGKVMLYLDSIRFGSDIKKTQYKYICMNVEDVDLFYKIQDTFQIPIQHRTEKQKEFLKKIKIKRITILYSDMKNHKISYIKEQRKQPESVTNTYHSGYRYKDYSEWIQGHRSM